MKSRQFIWLLLFSTAFNLLGFASVKISEEHLALKKAFILIRSEENQFQLQKFKRQINNELWLQNVSAQIETYKRSEPLPQAKIFQTAYSGNYDVILLIDQVAKYSIDNRVTNAMIKVGAKYKIRSYNLKKTPYVWIDHGDSNCNISVEMSLKSFTNRLLLSLNIEPEESSSQIQDILIATSNEQMSVYKNLLEQIEYQKHKTTEIVNKINALKRQLKKERGLTQKLTQLAVNRY